MLSLDTSGVVLGLMFAAQARDLPRRKTGSGTLDLGGSFVVHVGDGCYELSAV